MTEKENLPADRTAPSRVDCNGCVACCQGFKAVFLKPEKGDDINAYHTTAHNNPVANRIDIMLAHKPNGDCIYLGENGCSIYENRPHACRLFDCRKIYLTMPHREREALIAKGQMSRKVENAARKRISTLTDYEVLHCQAKRKVILQGGGAHVVIGDGRPTG